MVEVIGQDKSGDGKEELNEKIVEAARLEGTNDEEGQYRKRYLHCRNLMEKREPFLSMTEEEKDGLARKLSASEYLDLTCDWAFKFLFHNHPNLLIMLLNDILQENIQSVEFKNPEMTSADPNDKKVVFDLLCKTSDGRIFLCEMQKSTRSDQRDRLFYYGARLIGEQMRAGIEKYILAPVKIVCIMNYEDSHSGSPEDKILYQYRVSEVETGELFGEQISFHLLELPRVMRHSDEYDTPVAGWCRIFRNFSIFAASVKAKDEKFKELERAMRIRGLSEEQIERYFSDMISKEELLPYLEGSEQQGYRKGFKEGVEQGIEKGMEKGLAEGKSEGRASALNDVAKSMLEAGMSEDQITKITGLDKERIMRLKGGR